MPCDARYMDPDEKEINYSKVLTLLDELKTKKFNKSNYSGLHPKAYGKSFSTSDLDLAVSELCKKLSSIDTSSYSLELQMWWKDHKKADKARKIKKNVTKNKLLDSVPIYPVVRFTKEGFYINNKCDCEYRNLISYDTNYCILGRDSINNAFIFLSLQNRSIVYCPHITEDHFKIVG